MVPACPKSPPTQSALRDEPQGPVRKLRGNLGVAVHRLHGGGRRGAARRHRWRRPARYRLGQRRRVPGDLHRLDGDPAVLRGRFHRADAVCRRGGRVLLLCPHGAGLSGRHRHRVRRAGQLCGDRGGRLRPARPGRRGDRRAVRRPGAAVVGVRGGGVRRDDVRRATATSSCPAACSPYC